MSQKKQKGRRVQPRRKQITFGETSNPALTAAILEVVDNQLRDNTPPEARQTFERLVQSGYAPDDVRKLIGNLVLKEIFHVLKDQQPHDSQRYITALQGLPDSAYE